VGEYAAEVDAMMLSLSKGLGAPIGSVLCGSEPFIQEARRVKILFGGAWRQAGVVAAAGLVALDEGPGRLEEDHTNARRLAEGIAEATPDSVDPGGVETNIVFVDTTSLRVTAVDLMARLREQGVLANVVAGKVRFVTHRDVSAGDVETAIAAWRRVTADLARGR
jgi:threonine aldolase